MTQSDNSIAIANSTSQLSNQNSLQQADEAISEFECSNLLSFWPALNKSQIIAEMRSRIHDPFQVNQGGQPFCGPAAVTFALLTRRPLRYVEICRRLWETGSFRTQSRRSISPSMTLRQSKGNLRMPQVDWMVLSALRESENLIFPIEANAPEIVRNVSGMTKSWEIAGWAREILGGRDVKSHYAYFSGDIPALRAADEALKAGGFAFALITAEGMLQNKPPLIPYPSHWVALLGNVAIDEGSDRKGDRSRVSFDVYTWGRKMRVDIPKNSFENYFWVAITGR
ncbi:MAG: hypothetical protein JGK17_04910 [Microcoleus sp. PH2017_10_PVI_O_A]|uniref:hypothetical protein n=2 Tax=unclassified Microcoleus TaxID=2642155 RepID=UPI001D9035B5|nr:MULTISPECIES: hypothetical protein [unclassified Microcoleus]MCC3404926.1 hypothetical protein [Microcoleus sp. PH2017_10_PVI_O_A]MCC3461149.1 hypothetical protein [Microcoleus sp. PH2017_11_PCY_U_A]MCC3479145.1 hypothetical protein [Microcoleus sp. PH2017_12_PCY_D_A]MCC3527321.1 hypothetical protein [Microcoleus sp. PH2017_21_RUC_O_A]MCC3538794.1 hypothetical protein [Microcoleus sp. PH2017_22_RUC_O_B]